MSDAEVAGAAPVEGQEEQNKAVAPSGGAEDAVTLDGIVEQGGDGPARRATLSIHLDDEGKSEKETPSDPGIISEEGEVEGDVTTVYEADDTGADGTPAVEPAQNDGAGPAEAPSGSTPDPKYQTVTNKYGGVMKVYGKSANKVSSPSAAPATAPEIADSEDVDPRVEKEKLREAMQRLSGAENVTEDLCTGATRLLMETIVDKVTSVTAVRRRVIVKERLLFVFDSVLIWAVQSAKGKLTIKGSLPSASYTIIELPDPTPVGKVHFSDCFGVVNCNKGKTTVMIAKSYAEKKQLLSAFHAAGIRVERFRVDSLDDVDVKKPA